MSMEDLEKIVVLDNEAEADLIEAILQERDIPYVLHCYHDSALDGLFQSSHGWGHIEAPAEYAEEIKALYEDIAHSGEAAEDSEEV